jgi:hypothetical protein
MVYSLTDIMYDFISFNSTVNFVNSGINFLYRANPEPSDKQGSCMSSLNRTKLAQYVNSVNEIIAHRAAWKQKTASSTQMASSCCRGRLSSNSICRELWTSSDTVKSYK